METDAPPRVISADTLEGGVIITFEDGKRAIYPTSLLYTSFPQATEVVESEAEDLGRVTMPALIASVWTTAHPVLPYLWSCSKCETIFDVGRVRYTSLTQEQIDRVNLQFEVHCKRVHPLLLPIVGLTAVS
jgi:hypothetical protein